MDFVPKEQFLYALYKLSEKKSQWDKDQLIIQLWKWFNGVLTLRSIEYKLYRMKIQGFISEVNNYFTRNPFFKDSRKKIVSINRAKILHYLKVNGLKP